MRRAEGQHDLERVAIAARARRSSAISGTDGGAADVWAVADRTGLQEFAAIRGRDAAGSRGGHLKVSGIGHVRSLTPDSLDSCTLTPDLLLVHVVDHRLELLGVAFDGQDDGAFLDAVGARWRRRG